MPTKCQPRFKLGTRFSGDYFLYNEEVDRPFTRLMPIFNRTITFNKASYPAFKAISDPSDASWQRFIEILNQVYLQGPDAPHLVRAITSAQPPEFTENGIAMVIDAGLSIFQMSRETGASVEDMLALASEAIQANSEMKSWIGHQFDSVVPRLKELVAGSEALWTVDRAQDVIMEDDFLFGAARVITEVRPIFGRGEIAEPVTFAVMHSLKVGYSKDFGQHEFFVSLNDEDIDLMLVELNRAKEKSKILLETMDRVGLRAFKPQRRMQNAQ